MTRDLHVWAVIIFAILIRLCVGLHSYSGRQTPPRFGDYEAQRHWMELTVNLPVHDWYTETNENCLGYWGIDYPPLSAYQSWLCGKVIGWLEPASMELYSSRGYETISSKLWMRVSVIVFDLAVFIPGIVAALVALKAATTYTSKKSSPRDLSIWPLATCLLQPAALLIDHGHFQYNNIGLGLTAGAAAAVISGRQLLGSFLFCLALNHKQMALYYAPAFFAHLLGRCLQHKPFSHKLWAILRLGAVVVATFALVWLPYLQSKQDFFGLLQRLAPLRRGLFEDYVANFWCVSSLIIKWKRIFGQEALVRLTTGATIVGFVPSMIHQIRQPSHLGFVYCLANSALAFFMFSYQVHEKSVLLPLMPVMLLADREAFLAVWMPVVAAFSMFPLLRKDGVTLAYAGSLVLWIMFVDPFKSKKLNEKGGQGSQLTCWAAIGSILLGLCVHALSAFHSPPERLPFLFDAVFVSLACLHLCVITIHLNWQQLQLKSD